MSQERMVSGELWDRWEKRGSDEESEYFRQGDIMHEIYMSCKNDKDLMELYTDLGEYVDRYLNKVLSRQLAGNTDYEREYATSLIESADGAQRHTHNALLDQLGIIARLAKKKGRDTAEWWDGKDGFKDASREHIGDWARGVAFERMRAREEATTYAA